MSSKRHAQPKRRTISLMRDIGAAARDCPLAPPEHASVQSRTLHRACIILGGVAPLVEKLGVEQPEAERWLRGDEPVPEPIFLQAVEIVLLHAASIGREH
jgi:hypothetical protein